MGQALRVLLVEDSDDDALLMRCALEAAGLDCDLRRVCTEEQLRHALADFRPEVVVSDLDLPGYCGGEAIALVHDTHPGLPLVVMSGHPAGAHALALPAQVPAPVLDKGQLHALAPLLAALLQRPVA